MTLVSAESQASQGTDLVYSTYVGTSSYDGAQAMTVDDNGRAYVVVQTESTTGFPDPTSSPTDSAAHEVDMAVFRLNPDGTAIEYVLYFNPDPNTTEAEDYGFDIAVDSSGAAYIVGQADKPDFCSFMGVVPGYDPTYNGGNDAFIMKIKPDGSGLEYCTFIGGTDWETAYTLELDQDNNAYIAGYTWSSDFPVTGGAYDTTINGSRDIFVAKVSADGTRLDFATYMGGTNQESATALALDSQNNAYVTGWTNSDDLPIPTAVLDNTYDGPFDGFLFKLTSDGSDLLLNSYIGGTDEDRGSALVIDDQDNVYLLGNTRSDDLPTTPGAFDTTWGGGTCYFVNCADGFVMKLNPAVTTLQYGTYFGGDNEDSAYNMALTQSGNLYITGESISAVDFPTTSNGYDPTPNGEGDAYLLSLSGNLAVVHYGTYLGSTNVDRGIDLWTDGQSTVYLTGLTLSTDFPTTVGSYDTVHNGDYDIFVSKLVLPEIMQDFMSFVPAVFN